MQEITHKRRGQPTKYSKELTDKICNLLTEGKSLKSICDMKDMPDRTSVYSWLLQYPEFFNSYARARDIQADVLADTLIQEANDVESVIVGNDKSDNARVQAVRVKIDTLKWIASKLKPKKYGDKLELGGDQDNPITIELVSYANKMLKAPSKVVDEENTGEE